MSPARVRTLWLKEAARFRHNRGAVVLVVLLLAFALLLATFGTGVNPAADLGGVSHCYVDAFFDDPWTAHLYGHVPPDLAGKLFVRPAHREFGPAGPTYPNAAAAIQLRPRPAGGVTVRIIAPGGNRAAVAPFEAWFWAETGRFYAAQADATARARLVEPPATAADLWPAVYDHLRRTLSAQGGPVPPDLVVEAADVTGEAFDMRQAIAMGLTLFGVFFACVMLMPSFAAEERERGVLLAQMISPASAGEIVLAKFLFYAPLALTLAFTLAGLCKPVVLRQPLLWFALPAATLAAFSLGLVVASVATTQRAASMGAMCYLLAAAMLIVICVIADIPGLPYLLVEFHVPRMLQAVFAEQVTFAHWKNLLGTLFLGLCWLSVGLRLFRQRGWQ